MEVIERRTTSTPRRSSSVRMSLRLMALPARWTARQINNIYHHGEHLVHFHHHHESHVVRHDHLEVPVTILPQNEVHKSNPDLCTLPFTTLDEEEEDYYDYSSPLSTPVTPTAPKLPIETPISYHPGFATLIRRRRGSMPIRGLSYYYCCYFFTCFTKKKNTHHYNYI